VRAFDGSGLVARAEGGDLTISEFRHRHTGARYTAVVNNSQTRDVEARLWFSGHGLRLHHLRFGGREDTLAPAPAAFDHARFSHWLSPGQLEMLRVESLPES
jgi:hypothetical protein